MAPTLARPTRAALIGTLAVALAGLTLPASAQAASATGVVLNNISKSSALHTDPNSDAQSDDSTVRSGDRVYLGASSDPAKLTGWLTLDDGSRKAFGPGDYTVSSAGDHEYTIAFKGTSLTFAVAKSDKVPSVFIKTTGGLANIEAAKGNADKGGSMAMVNADGSTRYNGVLAEMKGRGNATWAYAKKPYQIKLDKSTELVPGAGKSKTWLLLANYLDNSNIRNELTYNMESAVLQRAGASDFSIKGQVTDLFVDGAYRGTYYLAEKVQVDNNRVAITDTDKANEAANPGVDLGAAATKTVSAGDARFLGIQAGQYVDYPNPAADYTSSGYLFEMDFADRAAEERSYFVTRRGTPMTVTTPENANEAEFAYASGYVQDFEDALFAPGGKNAKGKSWQDYVDVDSFARFYAMEELWANDDAFKSSTYFYMDKGGKLVASPVWDSDRTLGALTNAPAPSNIHVAQSSRVKTQWIKQLQSKPEFRQAVASAYANQVGPEADAVLASKLTTYADEVAYAAKMDKLRWSTRPSNVVTSAKPADDVARLRSYLSTRNTALKAQFNTSAYLKNAALPDGIYRISNGNLVADIAGQSTSDGANADLWNNNGQNNQRFRITRGDDGYYTIVNVNSGKALDVYQGKGADGQNVIQWAPKNVMNQKWLINTYDGANYTIMSALSVPAVAQHAGGAQVGWVLTATGDGTKAGTNLEIRTDTGSRGQNFTISSTTPTPPTTPPTPPTKTGATPTIGKTYTIAIAAKPTQVLDVTGGNKNNGANIQLSALTATTRQQFTVTAGPNGTYILKTGYGKVLDVAGNGMTIRTNVDQWQANGGTNQQWILKPTGDADGSYYIISKLNGLYLNAAGSATTNGTNIWMYTNNGGPAYKFIFTAK